MSGPVYQANLQVVGALLVDGDGRILLGRRASWKSIAPNLWDGIGGRVEQGESLEQALQRELFEEIGIVPTTYRLLASVPDPEPGRYGNAIHHVYVVSAWTGGEPYNASDEHSEIRWFTREQVLALPDTTAFDFADLLNRALSYSATGPE